MVKRRYSFVLAPILLLISVTAASAQLNGINIKGDVGLQAGTQPPPGIYLNNLNYFYGADEIKGRNGNRLGLQGDINLYLNATAFVWVPKKKVLGGNYSFSAAVPFMNNNPDLPRLNVDENHFGLSDIYIQPLGLGWHKPQADFNVGYAIVLPTGKFTQGADDNTGLGMVGHEFTAGVTGYLNKKREWHASTAAAFDIHHNKRTADIRVGEMLTLEGGVGRSWKQGGINAGAVYFAQWKLTSDSGSDLSRVLQLAGVENFKNRSFGVGPEFNMVIPKIEGQLMFRYLKEFGNRVSTQGQTFVVSLTFFLHKPFAQMRKQQPPPSSSTRP